MTSNIPTLVENEAVEPMYPRGSGAKQLAFIGDAGFNFTGTNKIYQFSSYQEAVLAVEDGGIGLPTEQPAFSCII